MTSESFCRLLLLKWKVSEFKWKSKEVLKVSLLFSLLLAPVFGNETFQPTKLVLNKWFDLYFLSENLGAFWGENWMDFYKFENDLNSQKN